MSPIDGSINISGGPQGGFPQEYIFISAHAGQAAHSSRQAHTRVYEWCGVTVFERCQCTQVPPTVPQVLWSVWGHTGSFPVSERGAR